VWSPDGAILASGAGDGSIGLWRFTDKSCAWIEGAGIPCCSLAISPAGDEIAAGFLDGTVRIWTIDGGTLLAEKALRSRRDRRLDQPVQVAWSPVARRLACRGVDRLAVFDLNVGGGPDFNVPSGTANFALSWTADAKCLLFGVPSQAGSWELGSKRFLWRADDGGPILNMASSSAGTLAIATGPSVELRDVVAGQELRRPLDVSAAWGVAFTPDERILIAYGDAVFSLWRTDRWTSIGTFRHCVDDFAAPVVPPNLAFRPGPRREVTLAVAGSRDVFVLGLAVPRLLKMVTSELGARDLAFESGAPAADARPVAPERFAPRSMEVRPPPVEGGRPHVFLSYDREDQDEVSRIASVLQKEGRSFWMDVERLVPGQSFPQGLGQGLDTATGVVVFIGPGGLRSRWQRAELDAALILEKERGGYSVIPVLLPGAPAPSELPPLLRVHQMIVLQREEGREGPGMQKLLAQLPR